MWTCTSFAIILAGLIGTIPALYGSIYLWRLDSPLVRVNTITFNTTFVQIPLSIITVHVHWEIGYSHPNVDWPHWYDNGVCTGPTLEETIANCGYKSEQIYIDSNTGEPRRNHSYEGFFLLSALLIQLVMTYYLLKSQVCSQGDDKWSKKENIRDAIVCIMIWPLGIAICIVLVPCVPIWGIYQSIKDGECFWQSTTNSHLPSHTCVSLPVSLPVFLPETKIDNV